MLFFRDEEHANAWCGAHGLERRPLVTLQQLWQLSLTWYSDRLSPEVRRRGPAEMRRAFAAVGLDGPFWDPESDAF